MQLASTVGIDAASAHLSARMGRSYTDHVRKIIATIQQRENILLSKRLKSNEHSTRVFNSVSIAMFLLLAIGNILLLVFMRTSLKQSEQKEMKAAEFIVANKDLAYENAEKGKRAAELIVANKDLAYENEEKGKRAAELVVANEELAYENKEKGKRAAELVIANNALAYENGEKGKRAAELVIANEELAYENNEKGKRAAELGVANKQLAFENKEKSKRAAELFIANGKLAYENEEKGKRAAELVLANEELAYENEEKGKRAAELAIVNKDLLQSQEIANYGDFELDYISGKTAWSDQLCKIFGLTTVNRNQSYSALLSHIHPDDHRDVMKTIGVYNKINNNANIYHRIISKDQNIKYVHTWQRMVYSEEGKPLRMHLVVHDITDQTENIIQLKAQNEQLQQIAWLQSHKLRGPLATILGLTQLFKEGICADSTKEIIDGILQASKALDKVVCEIVSKTEESEINQNNL